MFDYFKRLGAAVIGRDIQNSQRLDVANATDDEVREFLLDNSNASYSGRSVTTDGAMRIATAHRCVGLVSGIIGSTPMPMLKILDADRYEMVMDDPIVRIMSVRPNSRQTPKQFKSMMQAWLMLRGNAYARKIFGVGNKLVALEPLPSDKVRTKLKSNSLDLEYEYTTPNGRSVVFQKDEIFHITGLTLDGIHGVSVLKYARESMSIALDTEEAASQLMKNGSFAEALLKFPQGTKLSAEAYERLKQDWENVHKGVRNAGKTAILEDGGQLEKMTMTASDLQFLEQRDFQRYEIAMFFGVPPHLIGATEKTTSWGSGIEHLNIGFVNYTLNDWFCTWAEAIRHSLFEDRQKQNHIIRPDLERLLKGDTKAQWERYTKGLQFGVYSPNDVRKDVGMNPRTDERGDDYAVPPNETKDGKVEDSKDKSDEPDEE